MHLGKAILDSSSSSPSPWSGLSTRVRRGSRGKPAQMVVAFGVSPGTKAGEAGSAGTGLHGGSFVDVKGFEPEEKTNGRLRGKESPFVPWGGGSPELLAGIWLLPWAALSSAAR